MQRHGLDGLTCEFVAQEFAPASAGAGGGLHRHIKAAIRWRKRRNAHATRLQRRNPCAVGTQAAPARSTQRQYCAVSYKFSSALRRFKLQSTIARPAREAVPRMEHHPRLAQSVQPRTQERRSLHVFGEDALRRAYKSLNAQTMRPRLHLLRAKVLQQGFHLGIACAEAGIE